MGRLLVCLLALTSSTALAQADQSRVSLAGYFRFAGRPDFQGGNGRLGFWNLYGRLMNEGAFLQFDLKVDLLQAAPGTDEVWADVVAQIQGNSVPGGDLYNGALSQFAVTQVFARAGNVLFKNVTWQLGTLRYWPGDLGLYDVRPATIFEDTMGLSAYYRGEYVSLLFGVGDAGFYTRGLSYSPIITGGGMLKASLGRHVEIGGGGQVGYEPVINGSRFSPYQTPGITYEDYWRKEVAQRYVQNNPQAMGLFPRPQAAGKPSMPWRAVGYLGFGNLGPLVWNNFFISYKHLAPEQPYTENFQGLSYTIYRSDFTDERYQLQLGDQMQFELLPQRLGLAIAGLYGQDNDFDNSIAASEANRQYYSGVVRLQVYLSQTFHVLLESSLAQERSLNGNLYREHFDSIFQSTNGVRDSRGLEFGDSKVRTTWQGKVGLVLNPNGYGVFARPSLRLLYGVQYSSQQSAFGNSFSDSLDQYAAFPGAEQHWHHLISLETEGWF